MGKVGHSTLFFQKLTPLVVFFYGQPGSASFIISNT
jgi:hypothetical protein